MKSPEVKVTDASLLIILLFLVLPKGSLAGYLFSGFIVAVGVFIRLYSRFSRLGVSHTEAVFILAPLFILAIYSMGRALFGAFYLSEQFTISILLDPYRYLLFICFFLLGKGCDINKDSKLYPFFFAIIGINLIVVLLQKQFGAAFYSPFTLRGLESINSDYLKRAIGTIGNPNILAIFVAAPLLLGLSRLTEKVNATDLVLVAMAAVIMALAQSRSTLVYALAALIFFFLVKKKARIDPAFVVVALVAGYFIYLYVLKLIADGGLVYLVSGYSTVIHSGLANQSSVAARFESWNNVSAIMFSGSGRLIFGLGYAGVVNDLGPVDNAYLYGFAKYGVFYSLYFVSLLTILLTARANRFRAENIYNYLLLSLVMVLMASMSGDVLENVVLIGLLFFFSGIVNSYKGKRPIVTE